MRTSPAPATCSRSSRCSRTRRWQPQPRRWQTSGGVTIRSEDVSSVDLEPDAYIAGARYVLEELSVLKDPALAAAAKKVADKWGRHDQIGGCELGGPRAGCVHRRRPLRARGALGAQGPGAGSRSQEGGRQVGPSR